MTITKTSPIKRAEELREKIRHYSLLYYRPEEPTDAPAISDEEFDHMVEELKQLESEYPELAFTDSPTQRVGASQLPDSLLFKPVTHEVPMMSLDNAFSLGELNAWLNRVQKAGVQSAYTCELKFDGMAVSVLYENGRLRRSATRGDGEVGDDITEIAPKVKSLPRRLTGDYPERLEVRGEIYLPISEFNRLNAIRESKNLKRYANPRNTAAGTLRQKDPASVVVRGLAWWCYQLVTAEGRGAKSKKPLEFGSHGESLKYLESLGLPVHPDTQVLENSKEIPDYLSEMEERRHDRDYEVDGVVIKLDDLTAREKVGVTSHHPRWAIAFKFPPEEKITKLKDIRVSIGTKGKATPFADLEPVFVGGSTVSVATLHNEDQVAEKDVRPGDMVIVRKAGDVIPEVLGPVLEERKKFKVKLKPWVFPQFCPCEHKTELVRDEGDSAHRCPNPNCPFQKVGRIEHFASRGAMDIEGLGEGWVQAFVEAGLLNDVGDIYNPKFLEKLKAFTVTHNLSEERAVRLLDSIQATKSRPLAELLTCLGIYSMQNSRPAFQRTLEDIVDELKKEAKGDIPPITEARRKSIYIRLMAERLAEGLGEKFFEAKVEDLIPLLISKEEPKEKLAKSRAKGIVKFLETPENIQTLSDLAKAGVKCIPKNLSRRVTSSNATKKGTEKDNEKDEQEVSEEDRKTAALKRQLRKYSIEGLGDTMIDAILSTGVIEELSDIYSLKKSDLTVLTMERRYGEENVEDYDNDGKLEEKSLKGQIQKSQDKDLEYLLFALSIPYVGSVSAQVVADEFGDLDSVMKANRTELMAIDGVGEVQADSIYRFMRDPIQKKIIQKLKKAGLKLAQNQSPKNLGGLFATEHLTLADKNLVVTGTFGEMKREEVHKKIKACGGKIKAGVSTNVDFVIVGANPGQAKIQKIEELNLSVVREEDFEEFLKTGKVKS